MASSERFRGSSEIPLTPEGLQSAHELGMQLARKGGVDRIMTSSLGRTMHTAKAISKYTHAPITYAGDALHPWHLGALEGQPVNQGHIDLINHLIKDNPDLPLPGRGPLSTADGESFNSFKDRTLGMLHKVMQESEAKPEEKTALVTHYRVRKLLDAWMRKGAGDDMEIDHDVMADKSDHAPGSLDRLRMTRDGPQMASVDLASPGQLGGGVYIVRHEETPWNSSSRS